MTIGEGDSVPPSSASAEASLIGIVIPTHGANPFLTETIGSVIAQTHHAWRLVVVCDGVTDETARVAEAFAAGDARMAVIRQPRAGVAAARNRGVAALPGDVRFVALLDHDDRWLPEALATLHDALASSSREDAGVHASARYIDEAGRSIRENELETDLRRRPGIEGGRVVEWPPSRPTTFANLVFGDCIPVGTALVRRDALDRAGPFDERAVPSDDYDMWLRLTRIGPFRFVDRVVLEYRQLAAPTWDRPKGAGRGLPYVQRKAITSPENTARQAALARDGYRALQSLMARMDLETAASFVSKGQLGAGLRAALRSVRRAAGYVLGVPGPWHAPR